MSDNDKSIIEDTEEHFPDRFLTPTEKRLLVAKIIRYTSTSIAKTMPPAIMLEVKLADSNMINRFIQHCPDELIESFFINLGAQIRVTLTKNGNKYLGLDPSKIIIPN